VKDDGGLTGTTRLTVRINRNLYPPVMAESSMSVTIKEDLAGGETFGDPVTATDSDTSVCVLYSFVFIPVIEIAIQITLYFVHILYVI
jgi:hypothetical protein